MADTEKKKKKHLWRIFPLTLAAALLIAAGVEWATGLRMPVPVTVGSTVCQERRVIRIRDTQPPVIPLISDPDTYVLPGHTYEEEGFFAEDNYDGDLTSQVVREQTEESVTYSVTDSSEELKNCMRPF